MCAMEEIRGDQNTLAVIVIISNNSSSRITKNINIKKQKTSRIKTKSVVVIIRMETRRGDERIRYGGGNLDTFRGENSAKLRNTSLLLYFI